MPRRVRGLLAGFKRITDREGTAVTVRHLARCTGHIRALNRRSHTGAAMIATRALLCLVSMVAFLATALPVHAVVAQQADPPLVTGIGRGECTARSGTANVLPRDPVGITLNGPLPADAAVQVQFGGQSASARYVEPNCVVAVVPDLAPGEYPVTVSVNAQPLRTTAITRVYPVPSPVVTDVTPNATTRGSTIRVNGTGLDAPRNEVTLTLGGEVVPVERVAPDGSWFIATVPTPAAGQEEWAGGQKPVGVNVWGVPASLPADGLNVTIQKKISMAETWKIIGLALIPLVVVHLLVAALWFFRRDRLTRLQKGQSRAGPGPVSLLHWFLVDPENQTYSLSRAQFYWWLTLIAFAYCFLFIGRGRYEGDWSFPSLSGFAFTLLISLVTALVAEATNQAKGRKGAGLVHPSLSDLFVHGGVVAPERFQHVLWSVIAGIVFVWIVITTFQVSATLPDVPPELLALMGLSAAGYLGGKAVRQAGPTIKQVQLDTSGAAPILKIMGVQFSRDPHARVWIDGVEQSYDAIEAVKPPQPSTFVDELRVTLQGAKDDVTQRWCSQQHLVIVQNADGQRAEYHEATPVVDKVEDTGPAQVRTLKIKGRRIEPGASLSIPSAPQMQAVVLMPPKTAQEPWEVSIREPNVPWPNAAVDVVITNPSGQSATGAWTPSLPGAAPAPAAA